MNNLEYFKSRFHKWGKIHLNNGGLSPISLDAKEKVVYWANRFYEEGFYTDQDYMDDVLHSRQSLSKLLGCQSSEIAFFQSTAGAISQLAFEFPLKENDEVLMWDNEYGSNLYPWQEAAKQKGAVITFVKSEENLDTPVDKLISKITDKTRVIAISWVQFLTGAITDIQKLSKVTKEKNIFLFCDVIQGVGLFELKMNEWGIDAVAGGSHKWFYSPVGVGYLALNSKYHSIIKPHNYGSSTFGTCDDPVSLVCMPKNDALKYEPGSKQVLEITALGASADLILKVGVETIREETFRLACKLRVGLENLGYVVHSPFSSSNHQSAFVNFIPKTKTKEILETVCNYAIRGPGIRLSPSAHNTDLEIEKVLEALKNDG